jgi:hypothetical protein
MFIVKETKVFSYKLTPLNPSFCLSNYSDIDLQAKEGFKGVSL